MKDINSSVNGEVQEVLHEDERFGSGVSCAPRRRHEASPRRGEGGCAPVRGPLCEIAPEGGDRLAATMLHTLRNLADAQSADASLPALAAAAGVCTRTASKGLAILANQGIIRIQRVTSGGRILFTRYTFAGKGAAPLQNAA